MTDQQNPDLHPVTIDVVEIVNWLREDAPQLGHEGLAKAIENRWCRNSHSPATQAALVIDRALRPATMPGDVVERPAVAANMVEAVERALLMPGVLENPDARQRINAIALAQALTAMQPAIQAAVDALEGVRCANAGNFKRTGAAWEAYDTAVLDCIKALATLRTVTEQGEG